MKHLVNSTVNMALLSLNLVGARSVRIVGDSGSRSHNDKHGNPTGH